MWDAVAPGSVFEVWAEMADPSVVALPWYHRDDYAALLLLFSDPHMMPDTFDAWLKRAEGIERQFQKAGIAVARVLIRPGPFAAWCKERNTMPDQRARLTYANVVCRQGYSKL
jgi:hypothetical protein